VNHVKSPIVSEYLTRLEFASASLPRDRAQDLADQVTEHIDSGLGSIDNPSEVQIRNLLEQLGTPEAIVRAAEDELPQPSEPSRWAVAWDVLAVVLTPLIWPVGVFLLWTSRSWCTRDKWIGTLLIPGGLYTAQVAGFGLQSRSCALMQRGGKWVELSCSVSDLRFEIQHVVSLILYILPGVAAVYLAWRLWRNQRRPTSSLRSSRARAGIEGVA